MSRCYVVYKADGCVSKLVNVYCCTGSRLGDQSLLWNITTYLRSLVIADNQSPAAAICRKQHEIARVLSSCVIANILTKTLEPNWHESN